MTNYLFLMTFAHRCGAVPLAAWIAVAACTGADADAGPVREVKLGDVLHFTSEIRLQENSEVVTVSPKVHMTPSGSFLVADTKESQIRVYSATGSLQRYFGRQGEGPGEFSRISGVSRLPSGDVVVSDMGGMITIFDSLGFSVRHVVQVPILPLYNVVALDENHLAVTGRLQGDDSRIHVIELPSGKVLRSFFTPPPPPAGLESAYMSAGTTGMAIRGDTAAATFALSDTVYLFRLDGKALGKLPFRSRFYRQLKTPMPRDVPLPELDRWEASFSAVSRIFWAPDGSFYIMYYDRVDHAPAWRWLHLARDGTGLFEVRDAPMLLSLAPDTSLIFVKPGSELPNVWSRAKVR